jgi:AcrR family transcriptional regulator
MPGDSYHHGDLHQAILDAAVAEARRSGPSGVQVRALAKTVGVSPSAVYRHLASLDALLAEVAQVARERLAVHLIEERDRAAPRGSRANRARERMRAIGRGYVQFALAEPHLFDTAFAPTAGCPPEADDPSAWEVLIVAVHELIDSGAITTTDVDTAALIAWSGVHGIASILVRQAMPSPALISPLSNDTAIDVVLDAIDRAIETL